MTPDEVGARVAAVWRSDSRRVLSTLIRLLRDFDAAEEAMQEAFAAALAQWPATGLPANPRAWLVSVGRFKGIDAIRRRARFDASLAAVADELAAAATPPDMDAGDLPDDQLRLVFTCCHPALSREAQLALTLREICGLTTEEIAHAFLLGAPTVAQRIVRAKAKIREARIPYQVPTRDELPARLDAVLAVVYLVFNEGYFASTGDALVRADLSAEAIRLGRLLVELLPGEPEATGLLALMLLTDARRAASGRTRCRPRSPRCMPRRASLARPTGRRSSGSTTCCYGSIPRPWSRSTAPPRSPCATARPRGLRSSR